MVASLSAKPPSSSSSTRGSRRSGLFTQVKRIAKVDHRHVTAAVRCPSGLSGADGDAGTQGVLDRNGITRSRPQRSRTFKLGACPPIVVNLGTHVAPKHLLACDNLLALQRDWRRSGDKAQVRTADWSLWLRPVGLLIAPVSQFEHWLEMKRRRGSKAFSAAQRIICCQCGNFAGALTGRCCAVSRYYASVDVDRTDSRGSGPCHR